MPNVTQGGLPPVLMLPERVKKTAHRTLPGLDAPNWQCQAHWFLTGGGGGLQCLLQPGQEGKRLSSGAGSSFWGKHGSHFPRPALPAFVSPSWALGSQTQNIKPQPPFEPRSSESFIFPLLVLERPCSHPTPFLHHQACQARNAIKTKLTFTI